MSPRMTAALVRSLPELRWEPIQKRIRATIGERTVVDSTRAMVVWEPLRVVPSYAVPADDVRGELVPGTPTTVAPDAGHLIGPAELELPPVLDPSFPFSMHTAEGAVLDLRVDGETRPGVAFRPDDLDLQGHVILDFAGFDAWYEEDERNFSHARDPVLGGIDVRRSSRTVRFEVDGALLAESSRALLLFEGTLLPLRAYLPKEDVRVPLRPSAKQTWCAYKGQATYWSPEVDGRVLENLAWSYEDPQRKVAEIAGLVTFFNERTDVSLDGERLERPRTPWS